MYIMGIDDDDGSGGGGEGAGAGWHDLVFIFWIVTINVINRIQVHCAVTNVFDIHCSGHLNNYHHHLNLKDLNFCSFFWLP